MRKRLVRLVVLLLLAVVTPLAVGAQELPAGDSRNGAFRDHMNSIVAANDNIPDFTKMLPGTDYKMPDGRTDKIGDGDDHGIWGREFAKWYGLPYREFLEAQNVPQAVEPQPAKVTVEKIPVTIELKPGPMWKDPGFLLMLLAVALVALGLLYSGLLERRRQRRKEQEREEEQRRERDAAQRFQNRVIAEREERAAEMRQDPITYGPPIVAGGVEPNDYERLVRGLEAGAVNDYVRLNPGMVRENVNVVLIGPIETGMIGGSGMVGHADHPRPYTFDQPKPGYRARFRFPDGREDYLMSLQGCMNPCFRGEGMTGFTFTPTGEVQAPPAPAPIPAQPVPVEVAATQPAAPAAEPAHEDGLVKIELRRATEKDPAMVRMSGIDEQGDATIELKPGSVMIRFTPRQK